MVESFYSDTAAPQATSIESAKVEFVLVQPGALVQLLPLPDFFAPQYPGKRQATYTISIQVLPAPTSTAATVEVANPTQESIVDLSSNTVLSFSMVPNSARVLKSIGRQWYMLA